MGEHALRQSRDADHRTLYSGSARHLFLGQSPSMFSLCECVAWVPVDILLVLVQSAVLGVTYSRRVRAKRKLPHLSVITLLTSEKSASSLTPLITPCRHALRLLSATSSLAVDHTSKATLSLDGEYRTCQHSESSSNKDPRGDLLYSTTHSSSRRSASQTKHISQVQIRAPPSRIHRPYLSENHDAPTWYLTWLWPLQALLWRMSSTPTDALPSTWPQRKSRACRTSACPCTPSIDSG